MAAELDHLLWAVPDVDRAAALFHEMTGVEPAVGGNHPGFGTRNQLISLGKRLYLEIIGPDPEQQLTGTLGEKIAAMPEPRMLTVAFRSPDLGAVVEAARSVGAAPTDPLAMSRIPPGGVKLAWSILRFDDAKRGIRMPFLIDWRDSPHPAGSTPGGCTLESVTLLDPDPDGLSRLITAIGADLDIARGVDGGAVVRLSTPNGPVVLT